MTTIITAQGSDSTVLTLLAFADRREANRFLLDLDLQLADDEDYCDATVDGVDLAEALAESADLRKALRLDAFYEKCGKGIYELRIRDIDLNS